MKEGNALNGILRFYKVCGKLIYMFLYVFRMWVEVRWNEETCQLVHRAAKVLMSVRYL